jgi:hypothetical protein
VRSKQNALTGLSLILNSLPQSSSHGRIHTSGWLIEEDDLVASQESKKSAKLSFVASRKVFRQSEVFK